MNKTVVIIIAVVSMLVIAGVIVFFVLRNEERNWSCETEDGTNWYTHEKDCNNKCNNTCVKKNKQLIP